MTAQDILIRRTGMSLSDAEWYEALAVARVAARLGIEPEEVDTGALMFTLVDLATLLWQQDLAVTQAAPGEGLTRHAFSEGGVSETVETRTGASLIAMYGAAISDILENLDGDVGVVRFI